MRKVLTVSANPQAGFTDANVIGKRSARAPKVPQQSDGVGNMDEMGQNLEGIIVGIMAIMAVLSFALSLWMFWSGFQAIRQGAWRHALWRQNLLISVALLFAFLMYLRDDRLIDDPTQWIFYGFAAPMLLAHMLGVSLGLMRGVRNSGSGRE